MFNIALIGCGRIGHILEEDPLRNKPCTHFGGMDQAGLEVTHACDTEQERLEKFMETSGIEKSKAYLNHPDLLKEQLHCAIIATQTPSHFEIARDCLRAGVKLLVLEKPVCPDLSQAKDLLWLSQKMKARIIVNHERRYDPRYILTKELLERGEIGKVTSVTGIMGTGPYRGESHIAEGGGPLLHDGTHLLDIILYFFGECHSLVGNFSRQTRQRGFEDTAQAWLKMKDGTSIYIEAGGTKKYFNFELDITGTEGRIQIGNGFNRLYKPRESKLYKGFRDLEEVPFPEIPKGNCFTNLYREVKNYLNGYEGVPLSSLEDGYRALELVHGIYHSSYKKKQNIVLPISPRKINLKKIFKL